MRVSYYKLLKLLSKDTVTLENDIRVSYILTVIDFIACSLKLKDDYTNTDWTQNFTGTLNGNGHTIVTFSSLYNTIEPDGTVKNLTMEDSMFFERAYVCKTNTGKIENVTVKADFNYSNSDIGGIVNKNTGTICNCTFIGAIKLKQKKYMSKPTAGGITEINKGVIKDCSIEDSVITGVFQIGGITAVNRNKVENCEISNTEIQGFYSTGGITGINFEIISNCQIKDTTVIPARYSTGEKMGGICGINNFNGFIEKSTVSSGFIKGNEDIGGICGLNKEKIQTSEVERNTKVQGANCVGTLCGKCEDSGAILNSLSNGTVNSENKTIGGVVGVLADTAICKSIVFSGKSSSAALIGKIESKNVEVLNCHFTKNSDIQLINESKYTESVDVYRDSDLKEAVFLTKI